MTKDNGCNGSSNNVQRQKEPAPWKIDIDNELIWPYYINMPGICSIFFYY